MDTFRDGLPFFPFGSRRLAPGAMGTDVKVLQSLIDRACIFGRITPDGVYGPTTLSAVAALQTRYGLPVSGTVDEATYFVLGQGTGLHTPYGGPAFGSRTLVPGDTGGDVRVLQNRLTSHRILAQNLAGPATGVFDADTRRALEVFRQLADGAQFQFAIADPTGMVGPDTLSALWVLTSWGGRDLTSCENPVMDGDPLRRPRIGTQGIDMLLFTFVLFPWVNFIARFTDHTPCRGTGDLFGPAVEDFQSQVGLAVDGIAGSETFFAVGTRLSRQFPPVLVGPVAGLPSPCGWPGGPLPGPQ